MIPATPRSRFAALLTLVILGFCVTSVALYPTEPVSLYAAAFARPFLQTTLTPIRNITQVVTHRYHTCALTTDNGIKCWGNNDNGRLGNGSLTRSALPVDVTGLTSGVTMFDTGGQHSCAVKGGKVYCWGQNLNGQLGDGSKIDRTTPVTVTILSDVSTVSIGGSHSCALKTNNALYCWGDDTYGQVGNNNNSTADQTVPDLILSNVRAVAAGSVHTCALLTSGGVQCWGGNSRGSLGDGTNTQRPTPVAVLGLSGNPVALAAVRDHTCVLYTTGTAQCWGANDAGQVGDGFQTDRWTAVAVPTVSGGISAIVPGGQHTCVLTTGGGVKCWGANATGQVGNGPTATAVLNAVDVIGLQSGVTHVAAGREHTCARLSNSEVKCWGRNGDGELGDNTLENRSTPVNVLMIVQVTPTPTRTSTLTRTPLPTPTVTNTPSITPTPTPTLTPPTPSQLPDLIVAGMAIELETGSSCNYTSTALGVRLTLFNNGDVAAGPFIVAVNGQQMQIAGGLAVKSAVTVWLAGVSGGQVTAIVDATSVISESNEANNSLSQFLPVPTLPAPCTPTFTPTPTETPTPTVTVTLTPTTADPPTTTPTVTPPISASADLFIPIVMRSVPPTVTPVWRRIGQNGLNGETLALHERQLLLGERHDINNAKEGGLYQLTLTTCDSRDTFSRLSLFSMASVFGVTLSNVGGAFANFDKSTIYYLGTDGSWVAAPNPIPRVRTIVTAPNGHFFAGSDGSGLYQSSNSGANWGVIPGEAKEINRLRFDNGTLWIAGQTGVWKRLGGDGAPQEITGNLSGAAREVWDFAFNGADIYIATYDGIYRGDGNGNWQRFGRDGQQLRSLALVNNYLYAGAFRPIEATTQEAGVWRRSLPDGPWEPVTSPGWNTTYIVRDLLYDPTCQGLLAATNDGVWLWK